MDVARFCLGTKCAEFINESFGVAIDGITFNITMVEKPYIPLVNSSGRNRVDDTGLESENVDSTEEGTTDVEFSGDDMEGLEDQMAK
ncbi:hypothetical protein RYX36_013468 [Vicia faba]